jgi:hypothetical protein
MEADYTAFSIALRAVIPLLTVIRYVISSFGPIKMSLLTFQTTVHEDNMGGQYMEPGRTTPRSKFHAKSSTIGFNLGSSPKKFKSNTLVHLHNKRLICSPNPNLSLPNLLNGIVFSLAVGNSPFERGRIKGFSHLVSFQIQTLKSPITSFLPNRHEPNRRL